ncbi:MAG: hypothetical protein JWM88_282 [Verrucomicrobia bacterium]|nr:hypothetical protein [Verrucomicrobiota bacterium]
MRCTASHPMAGRQRAGYPERMYGYTIAALAGALFLLMLFLSLTIERPHERETRGGSPEERSARTAMPSADEPTPDRSVTAKPSQVRRAKRRTPAA